MPKVILSLYFDYSKYIFFVLFNVHITYCNILFKFSNYHYVLFANIGTYIREVPLQ